MVFKHACKLETCPPLVEKESSVSVQMILVIFVLARLTWEVIKETPDLI